MANYVVSGLSDFVKDNADLLLKNFALVGKGTRERIGIQTGIKKSAYLHYLDVAPVLADGAGCSFSAAGTATLTQREISTAPIRVNLDICPDSLRGKYAEYLIKVAPTNDCPFEQYLIEGLTRELNKKIEKIIWQGDTSSASTDLKWFDGFLEICGDESSVIDVTIASGKTAYEGLKAVVAAIPEEALERGAVVFVAPAIYNAFRQDIIALNLYHFNGEENEKGEVYFPGTDVKIVKCAGLTGSRKVVASFPENLVYGCDFENGEETIKAVYNEKDDSYSFIARWNSGVQIAFPAQCVLGAFAADPAATDFDNKHLAGIATATASVATVASDVHDDTNHAIKTKAVQ